MSKLLVRSLTVALIGGVCALGASAPVLAATKKAHHAAHAPEAKPAPLADLTPDQLASAERVLTGHQQCEFNQSVDVESYADKAGYFQLQFKGKKYLLAPEPTTTGAVRLEDKKAGVVWIQVPAKSMLLNAKLGQRMVDACLHPEQRAAVAAVEAAGKTLGIEPPRAPASAASGAAN